MLPSLCDSGGCTCGSWTLTQNCGLQFTAEMCSDVVTFLPYVLNLENQSFSQKFLKANLCDTLKTVCTALPHNGNKFQKDSFSTGICGKKSTFWRSFPKHGKTKNRCTWFQGQNIPQILQKEITGIGMVRCIGTFWVMQLVIIICCSRKLRQTCRNTLASLKWNHLSWFRVHFLHFLHFLCLSTSCCSITQLSGNQIIYNFTPVSMPGMCDSWSFPAAVHFLVGLGSLLAI